MHPHLDAERHAGMVKQVHSRAHDRSTRVLTTGRLRRGHGGFRGVPCQGLSVEGGGHVQRRQIKAEPVPQGRAVEAGRGQPDGAAGEARQGPGDVEGH